MLKFDFDPNLDLNYSTTPLPFGLSRFDLGATASFSAAAQFSFLGISPRVEILNAAAQVVADQCHFSTAGTKLEVFGQDFLPEILGRSATIDSNDVFDGTACATALTTFEETVNRAKKALRDAQELVRQYTNLRDQGQTFATGFCEQVAGDPPLDFPAGDCSSESPEQTVQRFVQYYNDQIQKLITSVNELPGKLLSSSALPEEIRSFPLGGPPAEESALLLDVPFAIGPIPMKLEVEAILGYGITGAIDFQFTPAGLLAQNQRQTVAKVTANAGPTAFARIRLFVGAGFGVNGFSAHAGIEGQLTLANLTIPLHAGAGIDVLAERDNRPIIEADEYGTQVVFPPGGAQQYRFFLNYTYGAKVQLTQILEGAFYGKVKIKFFFFSKTWRAKIIGFDGLPPKEFKLFEGDGEGGASVGIEEWGVVQMPSPFVRIAIPPPPSTAPPVGSPPTVAYSPSEAEELFYDNLCTCKMKDEHCDRNADCCDDVPICFSDPDPMKAGTVCSSCRTLSETCNDNNDCCASAPNCLIDPFGDGLGRCGPCKSDGQSCSDDRDCCSGGCVNNQCVPCLPRDESCSGRDADCCNGPGGKPLQCVNLSGDPRFRCWCQNGGGTCFNDWECCYSGCLKNPGETQGVCSFPPIP